MEPVDDGTEVSAAVAWLESLDRTSLQVLLRDAVTEVDGLAGFLARTYLAEAGDLAELRLEIETELRPRRSFYDYRGANRYASDIAPTLALLAQRAQRPSLELITVIECALALTVRTILRSDDSSGAQGDQIRELLDLHQQVAAALAGTLSLKAQRRLATWLFKFRYGGKQDFFDPEIDRYAEVIGPPGLTLYRRELDKIAASGTESHHGTAHAYGRLAILDRDVDEIVRVFGYGLQVHLHYASLVAALDEAGLTTEAVSYARAGMHLDPGFQQPVLVDRVVADALGRGDLSEAVQVRHADLVARPTAARLTAWRELAERLGTAAQQSPHLESLVKQRDPHGWLTLLRREKRDGEAWDYARSQASLGSWDLWMDLCRRRSRSHPAETLPVYQELTEDVLQTTGRRSYHQAAKTLLAMRAAADAADHLEAYTSFLEHIKEQNRRRPTFFDILKRHGVS